jgi:hypothetical protein
MRPLTMRPLALRPLALQPLPFGFLLCGPLLCDPSLYAPLRGFTSFLHLAAIKGHFTCLQSLLRAGAEPKTSDSLGNTPLHAAVLGNNIDCVQELFKFESVEHVNCKNFDGGTPLHYATSTEMIKLLLMLGADANIKMSSTGETVFDMYLESMPEGKPMRPLALRPLALRPLALRPLAMRPLALRPSLCDPSICGPSLCGPSLCGPSLFGP